MVFPRKLALWYWTAYLCTYALRDDESDQQQLQPVRKIIEDTVNQTGFDIDLHDIGAGEQPDKVNENQCCNPYGEQHFFCFLF